MKRILVTGTQGFIGSHLQEYLEGQGHRVNQPEIADDVEEVYHLAAQISSSFNRTEPEVIFKDNLDSTFDIINRFKDKKDVKVLFTSSNEVNFLDANNVDDSNIYAFSKKVCEGELLRAFGDKLRIVRLGNVYGPRMRPDYVIHSLMDNVIKKQNPFVIKNPYDIRTFCYVSDVVEGLFEMMNSTLVWEGHLINLGHPEPVTISILGRKMLKLLGSHKPEIQEIFLNDRISVRTVDLVRNRSFGYKIPNTSLEEGLIKTFEWFKTQ